MTGKQTERWLRRLGPRNIGAIYVLITLIIVFSIWNPSIFANLGTAKLILNQYSFTGLVGLALLLPLTTGLFDLSVGSVAALAGITSAWTLANVSPSPLLALATGLGVALGVGIFNIVVVEVLGIDSFIGTLATGSIAIALAAAISGDQYIVHNVGAFQKDVALRNLQGVTLPVFITLVIALGLYVVLEKTAFGRRAYAVGFDSEVARLGGVSVHAIRAVALVVSAVLAGLAGILATAMIGAGNPATGPDLLLPAFAVAFLGATQFRSGRFNVWGTVVAVLLLGTGNIGLLVIGGPPWLPNMFEGVMLISAVALTSRRGMGLLRLRRFRNRQMTNDDSVPDSNQ